MRRALAILLLTVLNATASLVPGNGDVMTFNGTSYDAALRPGGVMFLAYFVSMYPKATNYGYTVSRGGEGWQGWYQSEEEKWALPLWAQGVGHNVRNFYDSDDNAGLVSNTVVQWGTNIANAPQLFYNGTAATNEGYNFPITFYFTGNPPHDSSDGDGGAVSRDAGCQWLQNHYSTPAFSQWNMDWTNGWNTDVTGSRLLGFSEGSHPYQGGLLVMCLQKLKALGAETNVGSVMFDWNAITSTTNHCAVSSLGISGGVMSCTISFDRMPPGYLVQSGTITNDGSQAFIAEPSLVNAMNWTLQGTNFPAANRFNISVNGTLIDTCTGAQLNAGRNLFTNNVGPLWNQRVVVYNAVLDLYGLDHATLLTTHSAGSGGSLGVDDTINYESTAAHFYDDLGQRGSTYVSSMSSSVAGLNQYVAAEYAAAQPTDYTLTITMIVPRYAPAHR
ncbi:MAG TPA: hypothetical protein VH597_00275 [Verrucomicrobiae bacterium]|jgi:hypothetical protein|nr:hypothetical protein [Verrucomicrobiae bacterium]